MIPNSLRIIITPRGTPSIQSKAILPSPINISFLKLLPRDYPDISNCLYFTLTLLLETIRPFLVKMAYPANKKRLIKDMRNIEIASNFILTFSEINKIKILI
jgi:hypothetical protein